MDLAYANRLFFFLSEFELSPFGYTPLLVSLKLSLISPCVCVTTPLLVSLKLSPISPCVCVTILGILKKKKKIGYQKLKPKLRPTKLLHKIQYAFSNK